MFTQLEPKRRVPRVSGLHTTPPSIGGMNVRDSLAAMPQNDAVALHNFICRPYGIELRHGYTSFAEGLGGFGPVDSLLSYLSMLAPVFEETAYESPYYLGRHTGAPMMPTLNAITTGKLFASRGGLIYNISAGGGGPFTAESGPMGTFWTSLNFQTLGGSFLCACPIEGGYWYYDGTTWHKVLAGDGIVADTISGVDPSRFEFVFQFKGRLWFVEKNSTRAWYLPPGQLYGVAKAWNFGVNFYRGGTLRVLASWTQDAGAGIDDYLVAVGSQGDVVIYQGYDPDGAPETFVHRGTWYCGPLPNSNRVTDVYGGDLYILSTGGLSKLSNILRFGDTEEDKLYDTNKVNLLVTQAVDRSRAYKNWQIAFLPMYSLVGVIIPYQAYSRYAMLVQDAITKGWSLLLDHPCEVMRTHDGIVYAGTQDGTVVQAFSSPYDDVPLDGDLSEGRYIYGMTIPAYSYFDNEAVGVQKIAEQMRIIMLGSQPPGVRATVLTNFALRQETYIPPIGAPSIDTLWDTAIWDNAVWDGGAKVISSWFGVSGVGQSLTVQLEFNGVGGLTLNQLDWIYQKGGPL